MSPLLFLGNGWADCVEIWYALGNPLVTTYAVVTDGVSLHVRTCTPRFCISQTARPIEFIFGVRVRGHELDAYHMSMSWVGYLSVFAMGWAGPWAMGRAGPWAGLGLKFWDFNGLRAGLG